MKLSSPPASRRWMRNTWKTLLLSACVVVAPSGTAIRDSTTLHVHVVPHTHDDVGWLKTVDQYFYGRNNTIQQASVRYILETVMSCLQQDRRRTFTYVEQAFFSMWWYEQSDDMKEIVRSLVHDTKQLTFVNGGWCMHDEAATHYMGMIDQTSLGHGFLKNQLNVTPRVGWQLDPFGHSSTQASLLTSKMGMDALFFGRIDHQDLKMRHEERQCEGIWNSSADINNTEIFWGLTGSYSGSYGSPPGFCFDDLCREDDPLIGLDPELLKQKMGDFLREVKVQSDRTIDNHIMLTMGEDFNYENALRYFENIDHLIDTINAYQDSPSEKDMISSILGPTYDTIHVFYSNPESYAQAKYESQRNFQRGEHLPTTETMSSESSKPSSPLSSPWWTKTDDFFPYADCNHCYWTGYFTSRAGLKRLERVGSSFLHAARQILTLPSPKDDGVHCKRCSTAKSCACECGSPLQPLDEAMGIAQHHDAVSGTAKQHVAFDYAKRISDGIAHAMPTISERLRGVLFAPDGSSLPLEDLSFCQLLNETVCTVTQETTADSEAVVYLVVYNALGTSRSDVLPIPVSREVPYKVTRLIENTITDNVKDWSWESVQTFLLPNNNFTQTPNAAEYVLNIRLDTPPGITVICIQSGTPVAEEEAKATLLESGVTGRSLGASVRGSNHSPERGAETISNGHINLHYQDGVLKKISSKDQELKVSQQWGYYTSFSTGKPDAEGSEVCDNAVHRQHQASARGKGSAVGKDEDDDDRHSNVTQNSGAYIFRPSTPDEELHTIKHSGMNVYKSDLVTEVHTEYEVPWIKQVTRIKKTSPYVEFEFTIGPIPVDDGIGKEVVTRYMTDIENDGTFYTDSNGREFQKRRRSERQTWKLVEYEPVAGNYYPVNAGMYIEDGVASMAVLVDRSQGGASLQDGNVELMVHRRMLAEDSRGVGEAMNETTGGVTPYPPHGDATRQGEGIIIRGVHRIAVGDAWMGARTARRHMDEAFSFPLVFAASSPAEIPLFSFQVPIMSVFRALPPNIFPVTLQTLSKGMNGEVTNKKEDGTETKTLLLRLAHQYGMNEDGGDTSYGLSQPVVIDFDNLFACFDVWNVVEKTLSGFEDLEDWERRRLPWLGGEERSMTEMERHDRSSVITISPMDIRTFELEVTEKECN